MKQNYIALQYFHPVLIKFRLILMIDSLHTVYTNVVLCEIKANEW